MSQPAANAGDLARLACTAPAFYQPNNNSHVDGASTDSLRSNVQFAANMDLACITTAVVDAWGVSQRAKGGRTQTSPGADAATSAPAGGMRLGRPSSQRCGLECSGVSVALLAHALPAALRLNTARERVAWEIERVTAFLFM